MRIENVISFFCNPSKSMRKMRSTERFVALAVDLFDGKTATNLTQQQELTRRVNGAPERATETLVAWIDWLKADARTSKKIAAIGWSYGAK